MRIYVVKHRDRKLGGGGAMVIVNVLNHPLPVSFFLRKQALAWRASLPKDVRGLYEIVPFESVGK